MAGFPFKKTAKSPMESLTTPGLDAVQAPTKKKPMNLMGRKRVSPIRRPSASPFMK